MAGFQCICGLFVILHGGGDGKIICPQCGTEWLENSVTLFDGTTYRLEENGRWMRGENRPKLIPIPTSRFFGEE